MVMAPIDRKFPRPLPFPQPTPVLNQDTTVDNAVFTMLDGNGDDAVSKDEWTKAGWTADRFTAFDGNGDGKVSRNEFLQARRYEREFNSKDWNKDGELSRTELTGFRYYMAKAGLSGVSEAVGGAAKAMLKCLPPFHPIMDRFSKMDANGDGAVSKEEYIKGRRKEETLVPFYKPVLHNKREMLVADAAKKAANE